MAEHFGDARIEEMKFLAELDRSGLTLSLEPGRRRDMVFSLVYERFATGSEIAWREPAGRLSTGLPGESLLERQLQESWVRTLSDVLSQISVHLRLTHKGRLRLSELRQALSSGRVREPFGILWDGRHLETDLQIAILDATESAPLSVGCLDMNGLKTINDSFGHHAGSEALRAYFQAVATALGGRGEAYRYGGDEVIACLPSQGMEEAKGTLRKACLLLMKEDLKFEGHSLPCLSLSVGIATTTDPATHWAVLQKRADKAMYRAKAETKKTTPPPSAIAEEEGEVSIVSLDTPGV